MGRNSEWVFFARRLVWVAPALLVLVLASSCDDDDDDGVGAIERTVVAEGPITAFSGAPNDRTIVVGGIEFDAGMAELVSHDPNLTIEDLGLGAVVSVEGRVVGDMGTAETIRFAPSIVGPITTVTPATGRLVVAGQPVSVDASTIFANALFDEFAQGNVVEVSGLPSPDGTLLATRIERLSPTFDPGVDEIVMRSRIRELDTAGSTFRLNGAPVGFAGAQFVGFTPNELENDRLVLVRARQDVGANQLTATRVERLDDPVTLGAAGDEFVIDGIVRERIGTNRIVIDGRTIELEDSAFFFDGSLADLMPGQRVSFGGTLDGSGTLIADQISLRPPTNVLLSGRLVSVDSTGGALDVFGRPVGFDNSTLFDAEDGTFIGPVDLQPGDPVELRGFLREDGSIFAQRLRRRTVDPLDPFGLNDQIVGSVTTNGGLDSMVIAGVPVRTTPQTSFRTELGETITSNDFFVGATPGTMLRADGTFTNGFFEASSLSRVGTGTGTGMFGF